MTNPVNPPIQDITIRDGAGPAGQTHNETFVVTLGFSAPCTAEARQQIMAALSNLIASNDLDLTPPGTGLLNMHEVQTLSGTDLQTTIAHPEHPEQGQPVCISVTRSGVHVMLGDDATPTQQGCTLDMDESGNAYVTVYVGKGKDINAEITLQES